MSNKCNDQHVRTHLSSAFVVSTMQNVGFLMMWLIFEFAHVCFVYNGVHHFKQHNSSGRTKLKEECEKDKGVSILMYPL